MPGRAEWAALARASLRFLSSASSVFKVSCLTFILFEFLSLGSSVGWRMLQECFYFGGLYFFLEWFFVCLLHTVFLSSFCFLLWFCVAAFPCSPPDFAPVCSGSSVQTFSLCWFRVGEFSLPAFLVVWDIWALLWAAVWSPEGAGVRRGPQACRRLPRLACSGSFPYIVEFLWPVVVLPSCFRSFVSPWSLHLSLGRQPSLSLAVFPLP